MYCSYYLGKMLKDKTWFVVGCLRAENNLVFERALKDQPDIFEFFVSPDQEDDFVNFMQLLIKRGVVLSLTKEKNRFLYT